MGGRRVSALLLGLLCLLPGALLPGEAHEDSSLLPADPDVATIIPLLVSSADFPDVSVSSRVSGLPDVTSEAPADETIVETEQPSSTVAAPESAGTGSGITAASGDDVTRASDETASEPSKRSPATSADVTQPPSIADNVTPDTPTVTPLLLATLRTTVPAKTQPSDDSTPHTTTSTSFHSTWMSAVTTTANAPEPSSPATQSTAAPHTTRAEVQRGPSVLEVGDDKDLTGYHSRNSSNPLFVMIVSVFTIMVVMVVVVVGFHRYKKRNSRTEFRRLQDLPMDDMMEDTPLSLYSY